MDMTKINFEVVDLIDVAQDGPPVVGCCEYGSGISGSI
jgi:hypothetical protein